MENKDVWQPDEYLEEFDKDSFDVEAHATEILKKGNINEEVVYKLMSCSVLLSLALSCRWFCCLSSCRVWTV